MPVNPRQSSKGQHSSASIKGLRWSLATHLDKHRELLVKVWVATLRSQLDLPRVSGFPDPAISALTHRELGKLYKQTVFAIREGKFEALPEAVAANHHEALEHYKGLARMFAKWNVLGEHVRRSIIADPAIDTVPTLYFMDRLWSKCLTEATILFSERRRTGFKRMVKHHRELKETAQAVLDSSPVGMLVTDREGYITFFNGKQEEISGVSRTAAIGKKIYEEYAGRSEPEFQAAFGRAIQKGETSYFKRRPYDGTNGRQVLDVWLSPIRDAKGRISGTVHVCQDVSEKASLEYKLTEQNRDLQAKVKELEEAYTYIGKVNRQFASLIDINNSLSSKMSLDKVLDFIVRSSAMLSRAKLTTLRKLEGDNLVLIAHHGFPDTDVAQYNSVNINDSLIGRVIREDREILIVDVSREETFRWPKLRQELGLQSLVSVPLHSRGRTIGVLSIHLAESRRFSNLELNFLMALANQAALAIDLERTLASVRASQNRPRKISKGAVARPVPRVVERA